ncbi:MAG: hypothetical protein V4450_17185 [Bacteroidota bacterium]
MFKKIAATLLLLCFMTQTFCRVAIVGSYYVNTTGYARNCINKTKPQLHCNGKCQMMKKLKQEEKKDAQNPERGSNGRDQVLSSKSHFASVQFIKMISANFYPTYISPFFSTRPRDIFHPPGA